MAKQHSSYETVFICDLTLGEEGVRALVDKFIGMINESGKLTGLNEWGKRRFAYPINDLNEGYYVLATFDAPQDFPAELSRVYHITEGIMRSMIIKAYPTKTESKSELMAIPAPDEVIVGSDDETAETKPAVKAPAAPAETPAEEAPAETPAEEAPAETPAEAAPAETPAEEAPAETPAEAPAETPAEKAAADTADQTPESEAPDNTTNG
jgi:small subunit ribosomal protein S6